MSENEVQRPWVAGIDFAILCQDTPVVAHEPIHLPGSNQLCIRELAILCDWNDQVRANVIHGAIFDEGLEELIKLSDLSLRTVRF